MTYTIHLKMSREELKNDFKVEPQEIASEAPLTLTLLTAVDKIVNQNFYENECFSLTAEVTIDVATVIDRTRITKVTYPSITKVLDFSGNNLLQKPINLGKI